MAKSLRKISVTLCYFLRHDPAKIGLTLGDDAWADIGELIEKAAPQCPGLNYEMLMQIVREDEKGRYGLSEDGKRIRCVQGHSTPTVKVNHTKKTPPPTLYHGTTLRFIDSIMKQGLIPGTRHHVHLSGDLSSARPRREPVVLEIDTRQMVKEGTEFFIADNGVWLTDFVPAKFIRRL